MARQSRILGVLESEKAILVASCRAGAIPFRCSVVVTRLSAVSPFIYALFWQTMGGPTLIMGWGEMECKLSRDFADVK